MNTEIHEVYDIALQIGPKDTQTRKSVGCVTRLTIELGIKSAQNTNNHIEQCTRFPKTHDPHQNPSRQKGDIKQSPY